ncbi:MAG: hypothetical protein IJB56_01635 [Alistipes sp.]|nr:hypothetical protein [Alistipes sp.]
MKLRNLFYLLLALPLAFAACSDDTTDPAPKPDEPTVKDPVLTLTSAASVEVAAEGETIEITYTLENKKEGVELEATCEAEWVEVVAGDKVSVTVAANEGEARETKVVVKYDTQSFEVALKQVAKGEEPVKPAEPKLTLTSESNVDVTAAGGEFEITYTLENKKDGVELEATCEAQWVDVTVGEKVKVVVEANEGDAREAKVVVAYETQKFEVTYKQAKKEDVPVVPSEPVAFVPKKVTASHNNTMKAGNFVLNLFVDDAQRFEFDMYDKVSANDSYLTPGKYTSEDGSIDLKYSQLYVSKDNKTAMKAAELELGLNQEEWTFTIKGSYELVNGAKYTIDWTGSIEGFVDPNAPEEFPICMAADVTPVSASTQDGLNWALVFCEDHQLYANPLTRINVQLPEINAMYIPDGTYSIADGTIVVSQNNPDSGSFYRTNRPNDGGAMTECELTVAIDKENETAKLSGYFVVNNSKLIFEWDGNVVGFSYKEVVSDGITEWQKGFAIDSQGSLNFKNSDGSWTKHEFGRTYVKATAIDGTEFKFCLCNPINSEEGVISVGEYTIATYDYATAFDYLFVDNTLGTFSNESEINSMPLAEGKVVVEKNGENYTISFDVIDTAQKEWTGSWTGTL